MGYITQKNREFWIIPNLKKHVNEKISIKNGVSISVGSLINYRGSHKVFLKKKFRCSEVPNSWDITQEK